MAVASKEITRIMATDCGSTTTKAILIEKKDGEYRLIRRGEAPTTVEAPAEDVTKGVLNAVGEIEDLEGRKFLKPGDEGVQVSPDSPDGVDIYMSTSSAGGGLQMTVAGVVKTMTGESAQRAALGAGAIVMDVVASNDGRLPHEKVADIRRLRPDMILLSGGIDGGTIDHVVELAEIVKAADPKPRFGIGYKLPVIYAGNRDARDLVRDELGEQMELKVVENLRPVLEKENLGPARDIIHELFMEHVMAQAPGYPKLMKWAGHYVDGDWVQVPIMPTPGAVGKLIETVAKNEGIEVMGVDIGGATTDVFSVFKSVEEETVFNRTVSANLGMSYSVSNVLASTGFDNVMRWVPFHMDEADLRNRIRNKMIRPTTIPQMLKELIVEQAIAREALRLALVQHKELATGLKGVAQERTIGDAFEQTQTGATLVNMMNLDLLIGSGGVLSHAPRRSQAALMLIDAFLPEGVTMLAVDSIFMMPQLGVLSEVLPKAATEVFDKDCLIRLGTCVAPSGENRKASILAEVTLTGSDGASSEISIEKGRMLVRPLGVGEKVEAVIRPAKNLDVGEGPGNEWTGQLEGGVVGLIFDGRGRSPFLLPQDDSARIGKLQEWSTALDIYPERFISLEGGE
ncbi:MAG: glutamate mutase L [Candidatus Fermentibacteraceae bacterium]|nr:glutamate mutase L [Candidatus Fermentibacteraceae bacterium]